MASCTNQGKSSCPQNHLSSPVSDRHLGMACSPIPPHSKPRPPHSSEGRHSSILHSVFCQLSSATCKEREIDGAVAGAMPPSSIDLRLKCHTFFKPSLLSAACMKGKDTHAILLRTSSVVVNQWHRESTSWCKRSFVIHGSDQR